MVPLAADRTIVTASVKVPFFEYSSLTLGPPVRFHVIMVEPFTVRLSPPLGEMTRAAPVMLKLLDVWFLTAGVS